MASPELDAGPLRDQLEPWRQQATLAAPLRLALIDSLLNKAEQQRPAVAQRLYLRVSQELPCLIAQCQSSLAGAHRSESSAHSAESSAHSAEISAHSAETSTHSAEPSANSENNNAGQASPLAAFLQQWQQSIQQQDHAPPSPLDEKIRAQNARYLGDNAPAPDAPPQPAVPQEAHPGLRAARQLQQRRGLEVKRRKVELALSKRPKNPGPLNPQMLAVKLLSEIQGCSPDYLERLVVFVETLTALEELDKKYSKKSGNS